MRGKTRFWRVNAFLVVLAAATAMPPVYAELGGDWTQVTSGTGRAARQSHVSLVCNDKMRVIGGTYNYGVTYWAKDIWRLTGGDVKAEGCR